MKYKIETTDGKVLKSFDDRYACAEAIDAMSKSGVRDIRMFTYMNGRRI